MTKKHLILPTDPEFHALASSARRRSAKAGRLPVPTLKLPGDFVFGASTSAYQIEGAVDRAKYGRGPSIWEKYFDQRPHLDRGDVACDHYNRMAADVRMIKRMGLDAYRFSISWPRILPDGFGKVNEQGLAFYDRLIDELLKHGIEPYLTLYHWDLPQALEDLGGWQSREVAKYFADFAALAVQRWGHKVKHWCTFNEPEVIVAGYIGGGLAPGMENPALRVKVAHNLMYAHGLAIQAMRAIEPANRYGIVLNLVPVEPLNEGSRVQARLHWQRNYAIYLDALLKGFYPDVVLDEAEATGAKIQAGDMALICQKLDYLGINWYLRHVVDETGRVIDVPGAEKTQMGWEICAPALTRMLVAMHGEYRLPPIYITENGAALDDAVKSGRVRDEHRTRYIRDHIKAIEAAYLKGVNVRGYFAWSLMDNLEWSLGFSKTFGIVHVDRRTLKRTVKDSGLWYRDLIAKHKGD